MFLLNKDDIYNIGDILLFLRCFFLRIIVLFGLGFGDNCNFIIFWFLFFVFVIIVVNIVGYVVIYFVVG